MYFVLVIGIAMSRNFLLKTIKIKGQIKYFYFSKIKTL